MEAIDYEKGECVENPIGETSFGKAITEEGTERRAEARVFSGHWKILWEMTGVGHFTTV